MARRSAGPAIAPQRPTNRPLTDGEAESGGARCYKPHMALEYRILGPLEAVRDGHPLPLGGRRERALLAILLVNPNEVLSTDRIFDELYGERPPPTASSSLQNAVSKLR